MKRKYLSALLMGTLTVASMSTFTSCKDYDDDISNLQGQIDKLASADELKQKVSELQALISANQSGINSLQSELAKKTTLDEVKAVLANYATNENVTKEANEIVNAAIKALQDKDIAELKTAIETAQKTADQAVMDAADAKAEILKTLEDYALKSDVDAVRDAANTAIAAVKSENTQAINAAKTKILEKLQDYATNEALNGVAEAAKTAVEAAKAENATELAKAVSDLETKIKAAQNTADEAKKKAGENAAAILALANTTTTANNALAQANANKTAIENALKTLGTGFSEQNTVAAAIEAINGQLTAKNTGLSGLAGRLAVVEAAINGGAEGSTEGLAAIISNIESKLKDIIGQYSTMVTDVQLFDFAKPNNSGFNTTLNFVQVEEKNNTFPANGETGDDKFTFKEGNYYVGEDSLLIRVSPVDAELTKENISLLNSQGKELDDIIEVSSVSRYKELLYGNTRAAGVNSGLWVVKFKAKDVADKFKEAAETDVNGTKHSVLYSVAVKNTYNTTGKTEDESTRRVTSEYGIDLTTEVAKPAYNFDVNKKFVGVIHNRYWRTDANDITWDKNNYPETYAEELNWIDNNEPSTSVILEGSKKNAADRYNNLDNRQAEDILAVEKGKPISIDFSEYKGIKGFYVTLDNRFAVESVPSEINAWNSYTYEGVGYKKNGTTVVPATLFKGNKGTITIKDMGNVQGDIIGFRVYAVNYDGTLTDPDGRAFYVAVGDVKTDMTLDNSKLTYQDLNGTMLFASSDFVAANLDKDFDGIEGWEITEKDASGNTPTAFTVKYYDKDQKEIGLSKDVRFVKFFLTNPLEFIDGATYKATATLTKSINSATAKVCTINASFTKIMPTEAPKFSYRDGFKEDEYIIPSGDDYVVTSSNKGGKFDYRNILIINNNEPWFGNDLFNRSGIGKFEFNVANGTYGTVENKWQLTEAKAEASRYYLNVANDNENNLVDNTTKRTIAGKFIYENISKTYDVNANRYVFKAYPVNSTSTEPIIYCSWIKTFGIKIGNNDNWVKNKKNEVTWTATGTTTTTLSLAELETEVKEKALLPVSLIPANGVGDGSKFSDYLSNNLLQVVAHKQYGKVYTTSSDNKQINPYFMAEFEGTGIKFTQRNQTSIPSNVTSGNIHFTVKDCFGNTKDIILPFVIKH